MPKNPTPAQSAQSRENGGHSHGPKTEEGKNKVRHNALKHGLTGEHVTLPGEAVPVFDRLLQSYIDDLQPVSEAELAIIQDLAELQWQIRRCNTLFRQTVFNRIQIQETEIDNRWNNPTMAIRSAAAHAAELAPNGDGRNLSLYMGRLCRSYGQTLRNLERFRALSGRKTPRNPGVQDSSEPACEERKNKPENLLTDDAPVTCPPQVTPEQTRQPEAALVPITVYASERAPKAPDEPLTALQPPELGLKVRRAAA